MRESSTPTAIVIGAGVVGFSCALHLQQQGFRVTLLDADAARAAPSWGNAGHLASEQVAPLASWSSIRGAWRRRYARGGPLHLRDALSIAPWVWRFVRAASPRRFRHGKAALGGLLRHALPAWRRLATQLGDPTLACEAGHWIVWENETTAARGRAAWVGADIGTASCRLLRAAETVHLEQLLRRRTWHGLRFAATGQIRDLPTLAQRFRDAFAARDGMLLPARMRAFTRCRSHAEVSLDNDVTLGADRIVVCAGVDSGGLMRSLGEPAPLIAERGYHIEWREHGWPRAMPPVVFEERSIILTRFDSGLRLAGFTEFARRETPPDPGKWALLERHARELGLPVAGTPSRWMGARPTLPDYLPAIGRSRVAENVLYAFGHQHLGLTLAAVTGELIGALAIDAAPQVAVDPFDLARFR